MLSNFLPMVAGIALLQSVVAAPAYFRADFGVPLYSKALPADLGTEAVQFWRSELEPGHSTPIAENGRIFLTTAGRDGLATVCVDAKSGRELWKRTVKIQKIEEFHPQEGNAAMASAACDGERVFVFFGSYGLICYDVEGKLLWEKRMGPFRDEYGAASSPIIVEDKVILNEDHDIDSFLLALDRKTGREIWKTARSGAVRSYSTPAVWDHNGHKELLVAGALELAGYDLNKGEKRWWVKGLARIVIPTPLPEGNTIYMPSWAPGGDPGQRLALGSWDQALAKWDKNKDGMLGKDEINDPEVRSRFFRMDLDQNQMLDQKEWDQHAEVFSRAENAILALKPTGRGDLTSSAVAWKYERGAPYVASPALHNGILWIVKDGGLVTKLLAATGELLQQERLGAIGNYYASPVLADGKVYFASENGVVTIVAEEKEWRIISARNFHEKIFATPLVYGDALYIRTEKGLYCFRQ
jgi:outer membrane protein assembly factor BamB